MSASDSSTPAEGGMECLLLSIRCVGLTPSPKSLMQSNGMFSKLVLHATGNTSAKNEKRTVKLSQSQPFKPSGRPPNFNFDLIYTSETFEDIADITPSLVAEVLSPSDMDIKLRLNVYYSSSLTSGKEILLAGATFSKRELQRAMISMNVLVSDMTSEHCGGSKAYVEVVKPLSPILYDPQFNIKAAKHEKNPLVQRYVFYNEVDNLTPYIDAEEYTWEPKYAAQIPLLFLENFTASLIRSTYSWNLRYELERMRQGRFHNMEEALKYGWHSVTITVHAARIGHSKAFKERTKQVQNQLIAAQQAAMASGNRNASAENVSLPIYTIYTPFNVDLNSHSSTDVRDSFRASNVNNYPDRTQSTATTASTLAGRRDLVSQWNTRKYDDTSPSTFVEISIENSMSTFCNAVGRTNTEYFNMEPVYGSNLHAAYGRKTSQSAVAATSTVQLLTSAREFEFSTYEVTDRDFLSVAPGFRKRTPTTSTDRTSEGVVNIMNPAASASSSGVAAAAAALSKSRSVSKESTFDSTALTAAATLAPPSGSSTTNVVSSSVTSAYAWVNGCKEQPDGSINIMGKETHFFQYVSDCSELYDSNVRFDFCLEDASGYGKRLGTCRLPLRPGERTDSWLPVTLLPPTNATLAEDANLYEDIELHVVVHVRSPQSYCNKPTTPPPLSLSSDDNTTDSINTSPNANATGASVDPVPLEVKAPANMPDMYIYQRTVAGTPQLQSSTGASSSTPAIAAPASVPFTAVSSRETLPTHSVYSDYRGTISDCYEWMWHLGFNGVDPMIADNNLNPQPSTSVDRDAEDNEDDDFDGRLDALGHRDESLVSIDSSTASPPSGERRARKTVAIVRPQTNGGGTNSGGSAMARRATTVRPNTGDNKPRLSEDSDEEEVPTVKPGHRDDDTEDFLDGNDFASRKTMFESIDTYSSATNKQQQQHQQQTGQSYQDFLDLESSLQSQQDLLHASSGSTGASSPRGAAAEGRRIPRQGEPDSDDEVDQQQQQLLQRDSEIDSYASPGAILATAEDLTEKLPASSGGDVTASAPVVATDAQQVQYATHSRVDVPYSLQWIRSHIEEMEKLSFQLRSILPDIRRKVKEDICFRPSTLKKQVDVQPLPINLHYQILGLRSHSRPENRAEVIHSITCGSMSPHMLGHKKGGLFNLESNLVSKKEDLDKMKRKYIQRVREEGSVNLSTKHLAYRLMNGLVDQVAAFEETCLSVGYRRAFAISQSLSIAVNAILLKLNLVIEAQIPGLTAEKWIQDGFLVVFEGLLSVAGHERSMLEDTISAVDALRSYQVRLLPLKSNTAKTTTARRRASNTSIILENTANAATTAAATAAPAASVVPGTALGTSNGAVRRNSYNTTTSAYVYSNRPPAASDDMGSSTSSGGVNEQQQQQQVEDLTIDIQGREVVIYVPPAALAKLPQIYQYNAVNGGAIINFVPVLFTQGIDIQQSMATTFGENSKKGKMKSVDLQHYVNMKALQDINRFAYKSQPIANESGIDTTVPHPLISELNITIQNSSITMKNVDMLIEVERVCLMLGGCRVTFCKSGKDRTGMAITLEQSRQLGERYGCGISQSRVLRDANLMRLHGVRILIAEKNIGRKVYSINKLQVQFLPTLYRPPVQVCEDIMKKDNS